MSASGRSKFELGLEAADRNCHVAGLEIYARALLELVSLVEAKTISSFRRAAGVCGDV